MSRNLHTALFVGCMMVAPMTPAAGTNSEPQTIIVCHSPVATREIRIYHTGNDACRVDYLKDKVTRTLWSASSGRGYCATRATALAATLARGNFSCNATGPADVGVSSAAAGDGGHHASIDKSDLTETQIGEANRWLQQRVEYLMKHQTASSEADTKRYSASPDFLAAADLDGDGRIDLVLGWSWASFRCDGAYLAVLINDASDAKPKYRPAEVELPGNCGAKGWLASVKDVNTRRIYIHLQQRYPGADNVQQISAIIRHDGKFTFFDPTGRAGSLVEIEKALLKKSE